MLEIKVLGYRTPERYALRRNVQAACNMLGEQYPGCLVKITEIKTAAEICRYTEVLILPSLVINENLVCAGRIPRREEIISWLRTAMEKDG